MEKLRIGLIGCGTILGVHLDAINALELAELVMVCDVESDLAESVAEAEYCAWTTDYNELLVREDIDVVHILTPHYLHTPLAIKALEAGKHVVLEKPVGISMKELHLLEKIAEQSGLTVGVTFQNRFNPTTVKMKEIIASGMLGPLIASKGLLTWCRKDCYYSESKWRGRLATEGGGLLINQAIHTLDLMEYVGGPVQSLKAIVVNNNHPDIEVEDTAMIAMTYESGAIGNFYGTNSYGADSQVEMGFVFEKGQLILRDQKLTLLKDGEETLLASDLVKKGEKSYWGMSHQLIIKDIYEAILSGGTLRVTLADAIRATELVLLCYQQNRDDLVLNKHSEKEFI